MLADLTILIAAGAVVLGVPFLTFLLVEAERAAAPERPQMAGLLRFFQLILLPVVAVWTILHFILGLDEGSLAGRIADTALAIAAVYAALGVLQLLLLTYASVAQRAPKLLIDLARLLLVALAAAIVVSEVWDVDLGQLVAALGVGSIVIGLALQNVVGGLVGGIMLLSFRPFKIGDVVKIGDKIARVVQLDWRMVILETSGERITVPTGDLSGKGITLIGPPGNPRVAEIPVAVGYAHSPEGVKAALLEAARDIPQLTEPGAAGCFVTAYEDAVIRYTVTLPLAKPLTLAGARHELLSRFWYVAQRRGIALGAATDPASLPLAEREAAAQAELRGRVALLAKSGLLAKATLPLEEVAAASPLEWYRPGEAVVVQGRPARALYLLLEGRAAVTAELHGERVAIEQLEPGDLHATRASFRGEPSPVRLEAAGELTVLAIPLATMIALLDSSPALARDIEAVLEARGEALGKVLRGERRLRAA